MWQRLNGSSWFLLSGVLLPVLPQTTAIRWVQDRSPFMERDVCSGGGDLDFYNFRPWLLHGRSSQQLLRPMSHVRFYRAVLSATLSRDKIAVRNCVCCSCNKLYRTRLLVTMMMMFVQIV